MNGSLLGGLFIFYFIIFINLLFNSIIYLFIYLVKLASRFLLLKHWVDTVAAERFGPQTHHRSTFYDLCFNGEKKGKKETEVKDNFVIHLKTGFD